MQLEPEDSTSVIVQAFQTNLAQNFANLKISLNSSPICCGINKVFNNQTSGGKVNNLFDPLNRLAIWQNAI